MYFLVNIQFTDELQNYMVKESEEHFSISIRLFKKKKIHLYKMTP